MDIDKWALIKQHALGELDRIVRAETFDREAAEHQLNRTIAGVQRTNDYPPVDFGPFNDEDARKICNNILDAEGYGQRRQRSARMIDLSGRVG